MKQFLLAVLIYSCFAALESPVAQADNNANQSDRLIPVANGPLETEREQLLKKILSAEEAGVGIKGYLDAFANLESIVKQGAPVNRIQSNLDNIDQSLANQFSSRQKHSQAAPKIENIGVQQKIQEKLMDLKSARIRMLMLVNSDRKKYNRPPLVIDPIANNAAQKHSDEMAVVGYCRHWDTAGKKPDQRYTESGGRNNVGENLGISFATGSGTVDCTGIKLIKEHLFSVSEIDKLQTIFMAEKPPHDSHRLQILRTEHNKIGIGLSYAENNKGEYRLSLAQEFVDEYGQYSEIPKQLARGLPFQVTGILFPGVNLTSVSVCWEPAPKTMTTEEVRSAPRDYSIPLVPTASFTPAAKSPGLKLWTSVKQQHFTVSITPAETWQSGLYYVQIWAGGGR